MTNPSDPSAEQTTRFRTLLSSNAFRAGIVVLSAAIIFGAWAFAQRTTGDDTGRDVALELPSADDLYEQARLAAEEGDTDTALTLLKQVLAEDPDHERAAALLRRLGEEATADAEPADPDAPPDGGDAAPSPPDGGDAAPSPPDDGNATPAPPDDGDAPAPGPPAPPYLDPVSDLGLFLPEVIEGWQRGGLVVNDMTAVAPFSPNREREVTRAVFAVNDRETEAAAKRFVEEVSKRAYPSDGASVKVGVVDAYFGTDGTRLATVAFSRGRYAFEVILTADAVEPRTLRGVATDLAGEFEVTR